MLSHPAGGSMYLSSCACCSTDHRHFEHTDSVSEDISVWCNRPGSPEDTFLCVRFIKAKPKYKKKQTWGDNTQSCSFITARTWIRRLQSCVTYLLIIRLTWLLLSGGENSENHTFTIWVWCSFTLFLVVWTSNRSKLVEHIGCVFFMCCLFACWVFKCCLLYYFKVTWIITRRRVHWSQALTHLHIWVKHCGFCEGCQDITYSWHDNYDQINSQEQFIYSWVYLTGTTHVGIVILWCKGKWRSVWRTFSCLQSQSLVRLLCN